MPSQNYKRRPSANGKNNVALAILSIVIVLAIAFTSVVIINFIESERATSSDVAESSEVTSFEPEPIVKVATATVVSTGDLLMHQPIFEGAKQSDGTYNFDNIFTYIQKYTKAADIAVANLETTLRGTADGGKYSGYPCFNCPDSISLSAKNAGFNLLLTANNHSYDTRLTGFKRTLNVLDEQGVEHIGTYLNETDKKYTVKDVNGIKLGMTCFTYETDDSEKVALNGIALAESAYGLVNAFSYGELEKFYTTLSKQISDMKAEGAEAVILYIHWGEEYRLTATKTQKEMAQKICDLGVDIIIGGHPHVVEPVELLTSSDNSHKTVCLYSMGNAVSNQRTERASIKTGHTEDGVLFGFTYSKYSDGRVELEDVTLMPTWVNLYTSKATGKRVYQIIPLDETIKDSWKTEFELTDTSIAAAQKSFDRTEKIVKSGMDEVKLWLNDKENYDSIKAASSSESTTSSNTSSTSSKTASGTASSKKAS